MAEFKPSVVPFPSQLQLRDVALASTNPFQAAAEMRLQMLQTLLEILATVDHIPDGLLLREIVQNAGQLLSDAAVLYRNAIVHAQGERP